MNYIIRHAVSADITPILEIVNHAITTSTAIYDYDERSLSLQKTWFSDKIQAGFPVFVAESDMGVIGFGTYGKFREKAAFNSTVEHSVYVRNGYQSNGIGKLLMQKLIETAKNQNYHVMIGCIDASNLASVKFHEKFGFVACGTIREVGYKFDQWLDLTLMQLILKTS